MSGSEPSSSVAGFTWVTENGRQVKQYHSRDSPSHSSNRHDTTATSRTGRRPSFAESTTSVRPQLGIDGGQEGSDWQTLKVAYTPRRRDSALQSSSPYSASSPPAQVSFGQSPSRHGFSSSEFRPAIQYHERNTTVPGITTSPNQRHPSQQSVFESKLSGLCREFAAIKASDYEKCYSFIKRNPEILKVKVQDFLMDAANALAAGKEAHAMCCVKRAIMIQECTDLPPSKIRGFFDALIKKAKAFDSFSKDTNDALANLRTQVATAVERPTAQSTSLQNGVDFPSLQGEPGRRSNDPRTYDHVPAPVARPRTDFPGPRHSVSTYDQPAATGAQRRHGLTSDGDGPTVDGPDSRLEAPLDTDFQLRKDSAKFFTVGRVFATVWYQSLGAGQGNHTPQKWITRDRFNDPILTHIQRMAVVKEGHGFCWCVPINSYNRKGVAKPGLSESDRAAHAIIHMEGTRPTESDAEHEMMNKSPIAVKPAGLDRKLDEMSRINFAKVHTIEHNVKVKNVGNISDRSVRDFERYWNSMTKEETRARDR